MTKISGTKERWSQIFLFDKNLIQSSLQSVLGIKEGRLDFHFSGDMPCIFNFIFDSGCMMAVNGLIDQIFKEINIFTSGTNKEGFNAPIKILCFCFSFFCIFLDFSIDFLHVLSSRPIFLRPICINAHCPCKSFFKKAKGYIHEKIPKDIIRFDQLSYLKIAKKNNL